MEGIAGLGMILIGQREGIAMSIAVVESLVHGAVAPGFELVREEFVRNFTERGEIGAACTVYRYGEKVVDLWGGWRDARRRFRWEADTLVPVFSTTKGLSGLTLALAHSRGWYDYEDPVARHWPEFAQQGKDRITIRQLLSHQAGLSALDEPLTVATLANPDRLAAALARQKPAWEPGTKQGYHTLTLGWYESELLRRVDPRHRSLGKFFQEEIAEPLDMEFYIGLPADIPDRRVAEIKDYRPIQLLLHPRLIPWSFAFKLLTPGSLAKRTFRNPWVNRPGEIVRPPYRSVEIPAANGIGQVRAIARAYSEYATGGPVLELSPQTLAALQQPPTPLPGKRDAVLRIATRYSLGFLKPCRAIAFGSSSSAFGTPGLGGSFGFADPDRQLGYAYAPNRAGYHLVNDPRELALRRAVYDCLS
jgi:CubicO group peptidase (beta-lactamase class C family)